MAEANHPPALQLKELFASYPKLDKVSPSSWFVWSDDPHMLPVSHIANICHINMRYTQVGYDYLATAVPKTDKISLDYLRMLIHGPFKAFSDLISLVYVKNQGYYLQCDNLSKWPANILFNFCIASRAPIEFKNHLIEWYELLKDGYPEILAYLMSFSSGGERFKSYREFTESGHHWMDPSSNWNSIISGSPDLGGLNYKQHPSAVTPANKIWGKSEDCYLIREFDNVKIAKYFGFELPIKNDKPKVALKSNKYNMYWDPEAMPQPALVNQVINQFQANQAENVAQWAAIHDEGAHAQPPQPVIAIDPIDNDVNDVDDDFANWLAEQEDDDD